MSKSLILALFFIVALALAGYLLRPNSEPSYAATSVAAAMGGGSHKGYRRAHESRPFVFPADHGPHPDYRVEWWYVTGNLVNTSHRHFGYQLTLFRIALSPDRSVQDSAWRTNQIYMGHFAVTDVAGQQHYPFERFSRAAVGLAGAQTGPFRVWLENWTLKSSSAKSSSEKSSSEKSSSEKSSSEKSSSEKSSSEKSSSEKSSSEKSSSEKSSSEKSSSEKSSSEKSSSEKSSSEKSSSEKSSSEKSSSDDLFPLRVEAQHDDIAIDLVLETTKPVVLQGEAGLSQKSAEPGNASYYYSYTRLPTRGNVRVNGANFAVTGASWLDREWSTSALGPEQTGWDWFALQLDDDRDLMFYRLRRKDGGVDPHSNGVLVAADGTVKRLRGEDVLLDIQGTWQSPETGDKYPAAWSLRIPSEALQIQVIPRVLDQEMRLTVRYWEGTVAVEGKARGVPISGQGYLEMTRYEAPLKKPGTKNRGQTTFSRFPM